MVYSSMLKHPVFRREGSLAMRKNIAILAVLSTSYFLAIIYNLSYLGYFLSPLNAYAAAGILLFTYIKSDHRNKASITFLFYSFACFSWAVADTSWGLFFAFGKDPVDNTIIATVYLLTNLFISLAILVFAIQQFSKWNTVLLLVDSFIISTVIIMFIWIDYLHKDKEILTTLFLSDYTSIFCIPADILILISVISWLISVRLDKMPKFMLFISFGVILFAVSDMLYYYAYFENSYIPNSMNDFLSIFALNCIAFGGLWRVYKGRPDYDIIFTSNTGTTGKWYYLFIFLLVIVLLKVTNLAETGFDFGDLAFLILFAFLYKVSRQYIQVSIENEMLLMKEKENNILLEQRVAEQVKELTYLANQDTLTSLINRRYFMKILDESIQSLRTKETLALLLIDLDRFKLINDRFGHDTGDRILVEVARRLIGWKKAEATVSRLGGDEFAVLFVGGYTQSEIEAFSMEIVDFCSKPIRIDDEIFHITLSIGIAMTGAEDESIKTLLKNADIAMYHAKSQGYNKYHFFDSILSSDITRKSEIEFLLKRADLGKEFELFFQPQFSLPDMKLAGAEALIRWKSPEHGYIPPDLFIPVAEEIDYIFPLGRWAIQEAIRQAADWNGRYLFPLKVSFNISPRQINDADFLDFLNNLISDTGINIDNIGAEITESIMLNDESRVDEFFHALEALKISVSLDDFGSGYSSLGYLSKYKFDKIKIDKTLIDNVSSRNIRGQNVVKAAIGMAKANGMKTVAEGVETQEQLEILVELGCSQVQGYLLGRPVPCKIFEEKFLLPS